MDDDEVVRNLARTLLARAGHDGTLVADGAEAVTAYRQAQAAGNAYDLVIVDMTVPGGMGGKETLGELQKINPAVRVIASSGYSNDPVMANHQAYGFAAVLPKPYDQDSFTRAINQVRR
jgi:CheY-like chemotaxis protein